MGFFTKRRKDAELIRPKDSIGVLMPLIFPKRTESEVSMTRDFDVTKLCKYVDDINKNNDLEFKMTYFHALMAAMGIAIYNRPALNRFVKDKCFDRPINILFIFSFNFSCFSLFSLIFSCFVLCFLIFEYSDFIDA